MLNYPLFFLFPSTSPQTILVQLMETGLQIVRPQRATAWPSAGLESLERSIVALAPIQVDLPMAHSARCIAKAAWLFQGLVPVSTLWPVFVGVYCGHSVRFRTSYHQ